MTEMNEQLARQVLGETIQSDGSLSNRLQYIDWEVGDNTVVLDSNDFTADQLIAIAWWMNNPAPVQLIRDDRVIKPGLTTTSER